MKLKGDIIRRAIRWKAVESADIGQYSDFFFSKAAQSFLVGVVRQQCTPNAWVLVAYAS
jgi:hypothetical protein